MLRLRVGSSQSLENYPGSTPVRAGAPTAAHLRRPSISIVVTIQLTVFVVDATGKTLNRTSRGNERNAQNAALNPPADRGPSNLRHLLASKSSGFQALLHFLPGDVVHRHGPRKLYSVVQPLTPPSLLPGSKHSLRPQRLPSTSPFQLPEGDNVVTVYRSESFGNGDLHFHLHRKDTESPAIQSVTPSIRVSLAAQP